MDKSNFGFEAFYSYHDDLKKEDLERALEYFQCALEQSGPDPACHATALFNFATSKFIKCLAYGTYSELNEPIKLYEEALELRCPGHPDRPATSLLLSQALLSRLGREYDGSTAMQIEHLLAEIIHDSSRNRRTADATLRTRRFFQSINSNPPQIDNLPRDLSCGIYVPPYGYFDRPHMLHKLGIALWERFQQNASLGDLDRSISMNEEALRLIPDGHDDQASIVTSLGRAHLRRLEALGDLTDVDMSRNLVELGGRIITALDSMLLTEGAGASPAREELQEQIVLVMAAGTIFQYIEQEVSPLRIPTFQSLMDEWNKEDSIPARCKRELGVLLSFLGGEGDIKMCQLLAGMDWPFKEYKTKETTDVLQNYTPYFQGLFETKLGIELTSTALVRGSVADALATATEAWITGECQHSESYIGVWT